MIGLLTDPAHWSGSDGIPTRILEHLVLSFEALLLAALIAVPLGLWVGHTGRGRFVAVNLAGAARALPTLGLLFLVVALAQRHPAGRRVVRRAHPGRAGDPRRPADPVRRLRRGRGGRPGRA